MENYKLTIGQIISKGFSTLKEAFPSLLPIMLIFVLPSALLELLKQSQTATIMPDTFSDIDGFSSFISYTNNFSMFSGLNTIIFLVTSLISVFTAAVAIKVLYDQYTLGYSSFKDALGYCAERLGKIILLSLLIYGIVFLGTLVFLVLLILFTLFTLGMGIVLVIPLVIFLLVFFFPLCEAYTSTMIIKDLGVMESFSETNKLFRKGSFWKSVGRFTIIGFVASLMLLIFDVIQIIPVVGFILVSLINFIVLSFVYSSNNILIIQELSEEPPLYNDFNIY